jgi:hypothetical protein
MRLAGAGKTAISMESAAIAYDGGTGIAPLKGSLRHSNPIKLMPPDRYVPDSVHPVLYSQRF